MTEEDDGIATQFLAAPETFAHESSANAMALMLGHDSHRPEPHQQAPTVIGELHGREQNVPYDRARYFCDERNERLDLAAQSVDEIGLC